MSIGPSGSPNAIRYHRRHAGGDRTCAGKFIAVMLQDTVRKWPSPSKSPSRSGAERCIRNTRQLFFEGDTNRECSPTLGSTWLKLRHDGDDGCGHRRPSPRRHPKSFSLPPECASPAYTSFTFTPVLVRARSKDNSSRWEHFDSGGDGEICLVVARPRPESFS